MEGWQGKLELGDEMPMMKHIASTDSTGPANTAAVQTAGQAHTAAVKGTPPSPYRPARGLD